MEFKIIADSCCDLTPELRNRLGILSVPLTMRLGNSIYTDDGSLDLPGFMDDMKNCTDKVGSAAPDPYLYQQAIESAPNTFVITISSKLSASYSNAVIGQSYAEENNQYSAQVFDSKSASAGETLIALKLNELISKNMPKESIIRTINKFIDNMKTYFVLENYDNLLKNGRLNKLTGTLIRILNIKLLMGSDGNGDIKLYAKPRGIKQMFESLLTLIHDSGKDTSQENMVISHCNNPELATDLCNAVKQRFNFKDIIIVPTGGLSSLYADNKGIVVAF